MKQASTKTVRLLTSGLTPAWAAGAASASADCARATTSAGFMRCSSARDGGGTAELRVDDGAVARQHAGLDDLIGGVELELLLLRIDDQRHVGEQVARVERAGVD